MRTILLSKMMSPLGSAEDSNGETTEMLDINPLRPNNDSTQTSHCNIKVVSVSEVMRTENMITPVKFY